MEPWYALRIFWCTYFFGLLLDRLLSSGRRRYIPEVRSPEPSLRALGERLSVNSCIQGSASDLMKIAMLRLQRDLLTQ